MVTIPNAPLNAVSAAPAYPIGLRAARALNAVDQADGLRRLFATQRPRIVPVAANPHVRHAGTMLERLAAAFSACGLSTLLVDAADSAPAPSDLAVIDLGACIERVLPDTGYLPARGLPMRHVDTRGSTAGFIEALCEAAPQYDVLLLHASASDLARLLGLTACAQRAVRPVLLSEDTAASVTQAYAAMKLLCARCDLPLFDLMMAARPGSRMADRAAEQLTQCAEDFLGAALLEVVRIDPSQTANAAPSAALCRLAARQLALDDAPHAAGLRRPTNTTHGLGVLR